MSDNKREGLFGRWSRLKREATASNQGDSPVAEGDPTDIAPAGAAGELAPAGAAGELAPVGAAGELAPAGAAGELAPASADDELAPASADGESAPPDVTPDSDRAKTIAEAPDLPSIDELDPDSDFAAFMDPRVDEDVRRAALKSLFRDPGFNVTDGLDVYAEDYTKLEKLTPAMVAALRYAQRALFSQDCEGGVEVDQANGAHVRNDDNKADVDKAVDAGSRGGSQHVEAASGAERNGSDNEQAETSESKLT